MPCISLCTLWPSIKMDPEVASRNPSIICPIKAKCQQSTSRSACCQTTKLLEIAQLDVPEGQQPNQARLMRAMTTKHSTEGLCIKRMPSAFQRWAPYYKLFCRGASKHSQSTGNILHLDSSQVWCQDCVSALAVFTLTRTEAAPILNAMQLYLKA